MVCFPLFVYGKKKTSPVNNLPLMNHTTLDRSIVFSMNSNEFVLSNMIESCFFIVSNAINYFIKKLIISYI